MPASTVDLESVDNAADHVTPSILIVEDEVIVAHDVRRRLEEMGYRVTGVASRGDQAVAHARRILPDPILMDIMLPSRSMGQSWDTSGNTTHCHVPSAGGVPVACGCA